MHALAHSLVSYLSTPRTNVRVGATIFEQLFLVNHLIFKTADDLFRLEGTCSELFKDLSIAEGAPAMNSILLIIFIISTK